jgi:aminopeptidase
MPADFAARLQAYAGVLVRAGLNLQPGQPVLITEPYELQGVDREAAPLVAAVEQAVAAAGGGQVSVLWGDGARLRDFASRGDWRGMEAVAEHQARRLQAHIRRGGACLFLLGSQPGLLADLPADRANELRNIAWANFGPVSARLTAGATQWSIAAAPTATWADAVFPQLPPSERLPALWQSVFTACLCLGQDPLADWQRHLRTLEQHRSALQARTLGVLHLVGEGTDLRVRLPSRHVWCTARLTSRRGIPFTVNLPTNEVFTAPVKGSAEGHIRVDRPVAYAGSAIEGIELVFREGEVVAASARTGGELLRQLLETDAGARRLGEVALVPESWEPPGEGRSRPLYRHPVLDENLSTHVALGSAYRFCSSSWLGRLQLNHSLIHVDLPLAAEVELG